ncbi:hypothetical protein H2201_003675 [Coniosporium apollinis]|uniref:RRM domain-containing protein n=1 Tax=Coniosporium apollinis TaxID=61459 RepID=A0ABQ9NV35_9PEZI|nr:hypothetical protein H2201_003675 [Coniosporium apollinis]
MDRALDDVINERQPIQRDEPRNLDRDWVHDRFEDDNDSRRPSRNFRSQRLERYTPDTDSSQSGAKLRVDNIHYDLTESDLRELFARIGRVQSVELLYDRSDRSKGIAYVVYTDLRDARTAIREFDGANANGQPIRLTLIPQAPAKAPEPRRNPFDSVTLPGRSLFDRIERDRSASPGSERERETGGRRRGGRRDDGVRHSDVSRPAPEHIDRYVPGQRDSRSGSRRRSPLPPRGGGRDGGRRPGGRREQSGRMNRDEDGRPMVQGRPRKTAEELDAEMADYWGSAEGGRTAAAGGNANGAAAGSGMVGGSGVTNGAPEIRGATSAINVDDDIDMIE